MVHIPNSPWSPVSKCCFPKLFSRRCHKIIVSATVSQNQIIYEYGPCLTVNRHNNSMTDHCIVMLRFVTRNWATDRLTFIIKYSKSNTKSNKSWIKPTHIHFCAYCKYRESRSEIGFLIIVLFRRKFLFFQRQLIFGFRGYNFSLR